MYTYLNLNDFYLEAAIDSLSKVRSFEDKPDSFLTPKMFQEIAHVEYLIRLSVNKENLNTKIVDIIPSDEFINKVNLYTEYYKDLLKYINNLYDDNKNAMSRFIPFESYILVPILNSLLHNKVISKQDYLNDAMSYVLKYQKLEWSIKSINDISNLDNNLFLLCPELPQELRLYKQDIYNNLIGINSIKIEDTNIK